MLTMEQWTHPFQNKINCRLSVYKMMACNFRQYFIKGTWLKMSQLLKTLLNKLNFLGAFLPLAGSPSIQQIVVCSAVMELLMMSFPHQLKSRCVSFIPDLEIHQQRFKRRCSLPDDILGLWAAKVLSSLHFSLQIQRPNQISACPQAK